MIMKDFKTHIVIMAGGIGSRLYPLSTPEKPKQFLDLLERGETLIQMTYNRFRSVDPDAEFWVVTSELYAHFVKEQLPDIPDTHILCEPEPRSTTPCIAYASWKIAAGSSDGSKDCVIVTPSDAYVPDYAEFALTMRSALDFVKDKHAIVCVGITPDHPETNYGYIHCSETGKGRNTVSKVLAFKEKPDMVTATEYFEEGTYLWNAGIFVWNLDTIASEIREHAPATAGLMDELAPDLFGPGEKESLSRLFPQCEKVSIDYSVMEKSDSVYVVPGEWEWSDLGGFEALSKITGKKY